MKCMKNSFQCGNNLSLLIKFCVQKSCGSPKANEFFVRSNPSLAQYPVNLDIIRSPCLCFQQTFARLFCENRISPEIRVLHILVVGLNLGLGKNPHAHFSHCCQPIFQQCELCQQIWQLIYPAYLLEVLNEKVVHWDPIL